MYKLSYYTRIKKYCIDSIYLQCIFSIIWFPLGAYWGMGSAWLSIIGNFFFGLVVHLFLWLSSLVFFGNMLGIPCTLLTYLLNRLAQLWIYCMRYAPVDAVLYYPQPSLWHLSLVACSLIVIMHTRLLRQHMMSCLFCLCVMMSVLFYHSQHTQLIKEQLVFLKKDITFIEVDGLRCLIDQGAFGSSVNSPNYLEYTFLPELYKRYGSGCIKHCFLLSPSLMSFKTMKLLCEMQLVNNIYIPYFEVLQTSKSKKLFKAFYELKTCIEQQGGTLHYLAKETIQIVLNTHTVLKIVPQSKTTKNNLTFLLIQITLEDVPQRAKNLYK